MYEHILAATDGTELGMLAVNHAADLADSIGASLTLVSVTVQRPEIVGLARGTSPPSVFDDIRRANTERSLTILREAQASLKRQAAVVEIEAESAYKGILEVAANQGVDLIVLGSHGHRTIDRILLGSQASKVLTLATVPVLIVK
jgi:Universal stress protein UspA and related nucleotide-binding proteins